MLASSSIVDVTAIVSSTVAVCALFFGVPAWRLTRRQMRIMREAERARDLAQSIREVLGGNHPDAGTTAEHPSVVDLLGDVRELLREQSELTMIVAWHMADNHGGQMPPWVRS